MPDFLTKTACRGRRPQRFVSARHYRRPDLIAKLLRERHVPRFIVAPEGFGKSFVALEYAETVFRFEHVFWIDAKSPCFLRDLDDGRIAKTLSSEDRASFLAVVEDVPSLDPQRVELLSREMDALIDRGCEVLVTCLPMRDAFHGQRDRLKLGAADLLLTDVELDALRTAAEREAEPAALMPTARRIATLAWGTSGDRAAFLASVAKEELPTDLMLPLFSMLCLQSGALADLAAFGSCEDDSIAILSEQYLYLGINCRKERFDAASFSMDELSEAFSPTLPDLAKRSVFPDADALATRAVRARVRRGSLAGIAQGARSVVGKPGTRAFRRGLPGPRVRRVSFAWRREGRSGLRPRRRRSRASRFVGRSRLRLRRCTTGERVFCRRGWIEGRCGARLESMRRRRGAPPRCSPRLFAGPCSRSRT